MKVLVAGSRGLIGSAVTRHLASAGHEIVRLVREEPSPGEVRWDPDADTIDRDGLEGFDAVVDVASMPWPTRWTAAAKKEIYENRVRSYRLLAEALASRARKPRVLICASGQGIYASSGDQPLTEESPIGSDFLAGLQRDGEAATGPASAAGIRVVHLRIPSVIGGPSLAAITDNLRPMGDGRQWWSWVALDELPLIVDHVFATVTLEGPINTVSPNPARETDFVATLGRVVGRRPGRAMPGFMLRLAVGEMADALLLASRRIEPGRLLETGYEFRYPELEAAFRHQLEPAT